MTAPFMSHSDVAEYLGINKHKLAQIVKKGLLRPVEIDGLKLQSFSRAEVEAFAGRLLNLDSYGNLGQAETGMESLNRKWGKPNLHLCAPKRR